MSITTIVYSVTREKSVGDIKCPNCGVGMLIENLYNKRNRFDGTTATCLNGCLDEGHQLVFYSYDFDAVFQKIERYKLKIQL